MNEINATQFWQDFETIKKSLRRASLVFNDKEGNNIFNADIGMDTDVENVDVGYNVQVTIGGDTILNNFVVREKDLSDPDAPVYTLTPKEDNE